MKTLRSTLAGLSCSIVVAVAADSEPLPQGPGLARNFPGDRDLTDHPSILLIEDFEGESLGDLKPRWNEIENREGGVLELVADHPEDSRGKQCLQVTAAPGEKADEARYAGAVAQVQRMGYDFQVATAEITGGKVERHVRLIVMNQGVAPFYQDWQLELAALGANREIAHR